MEILKEGHGELVGWHDPDEHRQWVRENKSRELKDKTKAYFDRYVFGVRDFEEYLERVGGVRKLNYLKRVEHLRESMGMPEEGNG